MRGYHFKKKRVIMCMHKFKWHKKSNNNCNKCIIKLGSQKKTEFKYNKSVQSCRVFPISDYTLYIINSLFVKYVFFIWMKIILLL